MNYELADFYLFKRRTEQLEERQKELEFGVDLGLFNDRVTLEVTSYNKKVEDLILQADNEPSSGFAFRWANAGALENKGIEVGLNAKVVDGSDISWETGASWFKNKSEITELTVNSFDTQGFGTGLGTFRIEEGKSATQIVGNDADGNVIDMEITCRDRIHLADIIRKIKVMVDVQRVIRNK